MIDNINELLDKIEYLIGLKNRGELTAHGEGQLTAYSIALKLVKKISYDTVLAPVFYTDTYKEWLSKYFIKVDKVFEYKRVNKHDYFTTEQLHKKYEKAMLESPFK